MKYIYWGKEKKERKLKKMNEGKKPAVLAVEGLTKVYKLWL